jgi:hypothetical protein
LISVAFLVEWLVIVMAQSWEQAFSRISSHLHSQLLFATMVLCVFLGLPSIAKSTAHPSKFSYLFTNSSGVPELVFVLLIRTSLTL